MAVYDQNDCTYASCTRGHVESVQDFSFFSVRRCTSHLSAHTRAKHSKLRKLDAIVAHARNRASFDLFILYTRQRMRREETHDKELQRKKNRHIRLRSMPVGRPKLEACKPNAACTMALKACRPGIAALPGVKDVQIGGQASLREELLPSTVRECTAKLVPNR